VESLMTAEDDVGAESLTGVTGLTIAEVGSHNAVNSAVPSSSSAEETFFNPAGIPKVTRKLLQTSTSSPTTAYLTAWHTMSPTSGGPLQNYALSLLGASATSSGYGTYSGYNSVAGGAIDNSTGTDSTPPTTFWSDEGCQTTRTKVGSPSWLLVDLGQEIEVRRLSVTLSIANMNFKLLVASASATGPFSGGSLLVHHGLRSGLLSSQPVPSV